MPLFLFQELLEKRIKQLEDQIEEEKRRTQRERMAVTKLQNKLIKVKIIIISSLSFNTLTQRVLNNRHLIVM